MKSKFAMRSTGSITLMVIVYSSLESCYATEPNKWVPNRASLSGTYVLKNHGRAINPIFENLDDDEEEQLEALWKAVLESQRIRALEQEYSNQVSLLDFEKLYWKVFDEHIPRGNSYLMPLGFSLTAPNLESDYPRHGLQPAQYFGIFSRTKNNAGTWSSVGRSKTINSDALGPVLNELLTKLVMHFKVYEQQLQDRIATESDDARLNLVDLVGEKAVNHLETWSKTRSKSIHQSQTPETSSLKTKLKKLDISVQSLSEGPEPLIPSGFPPLPKTFDLPLQSKSTPDLYPSERRER